MGSDASGTKEGQETGRMLLAALEKRDATTTRIDIDIDIGSPVCR